LKNNPKSKSPKIQNHPKSPFLTKNNYKIAKKDDFGDLVTVTQMLFYFFHKTVTQLKTVYKNWRKRLFLRANANFYFY
ncbi:hypothetical protein ACI3QN_13125, partial [Propionibacterium freudenreichii]|uniref:hypothetical protein n=1 Tax=Propionibacterium freudenreichii TaxID=1744 RepID=UPI0038523D9D